MSVTPITPANSSTTPSDMAMLSEGIGAPENTAFALGFRAGRTEGMISLIEAVTAAFIPNPSILAPDAAMVSDTLSTSRPCIMVVDDDPFTFDLLEDIFKAEYDVISANDGMTALDTASRRSPDVILLDVMMPGMSGYEVCRRLKTRSDTCNIPVMFITGQGDVSAETKGIEAGAVDFITKPVNPAPVCARVRNQIKLKWAMDKLTQVSGLEQSLREELLEALQSRDGATGH